MEKLKKGDVLYELFLNSFSDNIEELVNSYDGLNEMRKSYKKLYERLIVEYEKNYVAKGEHDVKKEDEYFDGIYYLVYQFIAWLNLVL